MPGHIGQNLPNEIYEVISDYIKNLLEIIKEGGYSEYNISNMDETPLQLNMVPNKTITQKGDKNVVIRKQNQEKLRITCILSIFVDGDKLPPYIIFKSKAKNNKIFDNLKDNIYLKNNKIFINFNSNAQSTTEIILDWIDKVYNPYINKDPLLGNALLIIDKASSHISDEIIESCTGKFKDISILPAGCTNILQPLDIAINKTFKTYIKEKYIRYCIRKNITISKVSRDNIINRIGEVWYNEDLITKNLIFNSSKLLDLVIK